MTEAAAPPTSDYNMLLAAEEYETTCNQLNMYMLIFKRQPPQNMKLKSINFGLEERSNKQFN